MIFGLPWAWVAGAVVVTFLAGFVGGCEHEKRAFDEYKASVEATTNAQKIQTEKIDQANKQKAKEVASDYEKRIIAIRKSYSGLYDNGSCPMPNQTGSSASVDARPTYNVLAESCAETTQQLISLQQFVKDTQ